MAEPATDGYDISRVCSIDDCDRPVKGRGWCAKHYARWFRNGGDPTVALQSRPGPGEPMGYFPAHRRLDRLRGRAADHRCEHCRSAASQWAYDNADPSEIRDPKGRRYSLDPTHYLPLCVPCHIKMDADYRERNGIRMRYPQRYRSPCGTRANYQRGCRCDPCRAAQAAYRLTRRRAA